jgi:hypothetical protein
VIRAPVRVTSMVRAWVEKGRPLLSIPHMRMESWAGKRSSRRRPMKGLCSGKLLEVYFDSTGSTRACLPLEVTNVHWAGLKLKIRYSS